jgi:hypothetical protein
VQYLSYLSPEFRFFLIFPLSPDLIFRKSLLEIECRP